MIKFYQKKIPYYYIKHYWDGHYWDGHYWDGHYWDGTYKNIMADNLNSNDPYYDIVTHYEKCLATHGATHKGVDWPNKEDLYTRYQVMLEIIDYLQKKDKQLQKRFKLLDLGCGYGGLIDFLNTTKINKQIDYHGIDLSAEMIVAAKQQFPNHSFESKDILVDKLTENSFDIIIMNGLFTEKCSLTTKQMHVFFEDMLIVAYRACTKGMAFNVMSNHVDWKRDDLFHVAFDKLAQFLCANISRDFIFRSDYKLYEYSCYVFKN